MGWLLHARYVRGEHARCLALVDMLLKRTHNKHPYAHYIKGLVLLDAGRVQEALERFHSCIRLQPMEVEPLKQVAKCLYRQGRYQLALEAYLEAKKLSKHPDPDIYCALAECWWKLGEVGRGVESARAAAGGAGGERAGALLARLLLAAGDQRAALQAYDDTIAGCWCGAETLGGAGALWVRAGSPRRAFQLLGAALALQPTHHAAALALAAMMLHHRDFDAALARLKAALSGHPTCVAAHSNLGLALMAKKKHVAALTCLQRGAGAAPLSARAAHNLGLALVGARRPVSAFCRLAAAAALRPHPHPHPHTVLLLGIALEQLGDSRADAAYERATSLAPCDALVALNGSARLARAGRLSAAAALAGRTHALLHAQDKPDTHLLSALATLREQLQDAGVEVPPDTGRAREQTSTPTLATDEVSCKDRTASLVVLPPLVLGYDELYSEETTSHNTNNADLENNGISQVSQEAIKKLSDKNIKEVVVKRLKGGIDSDHITFTGNFELPKELLSCPCNKNKH